MALSKVEQDYRRLLEQAVAAFHAGDRRRSADKYLEAFRNSPSDWTKDRYHTLHGYTSVLRERYFEPSQEDFNALATIGDSKHEPHVYRSEAMWTLGLLKSDLGKRQYCADLYRSAIHLIDTAKPKERKKTVMASLYDTSRKGMESQYAIRWDRHGKCEAQAVVSFGTHVMQLFGLKAKPELNSQLVDILGPDPNNEGRWKTRLVVNLNPQGDGTMSIATEKLKHIRPVA
ncbi:expressed unknown protein [Seminavis robusta]|uniref:Uncharacterized protein n=1 Tax=Seminavis robusta TaxID=568900 RepID=A0A9N8E395_9STRA|nr:expressed unknown protein [Seminavis robusta]|eukprot:Sro458_g147170.1 n/a (230) ;mRNA; r:51864-59391